MFETKLIDRADNFRRRNKIPKFKVTGSNIQVTSSNDELEILNHDVNQNIEQDKENEHMYDLVSNKNYDKATIVNEYDDDNLEFFTSSYSNTFVNSDSNAIASGSNIISSYNNTSSYYHESASSSDDDKATKNVTLQTNKDILKSSLPIKKNVDIISNRTQQKCDTNFVRIEQNLENHVPSQIQRKDALFASNGTMKSSSPIKEIIDRVSNRTQQKNDANFKKNEGNPIPKWIST
ncbi:hypothetical protein F8M41_015534 [Gigaspora margarita]|uniref:Uncharacterized protein n=1 Tax=Gigaspora margarita TaxID=4874 RepID=A0A8H3WTY5_GIGMA|nr:hypothetical protein F8M41_015534 [Gigaspora margarita]